MANKITRIDENEYIFKDQVDWKNIYRSKAFTEAMSYFNLSDDKTRTLLLSVNEAGQENILRSLANKLYGYIVSKIYNIDFGEIPNSKGDFTKVPNYKMIVDCLDVLSQILENYKQPTDQIDVINIAIQNLIDRKDIFARAYRLNIEMPIITYNTMALSIISAISLLISAHIEYIKQPDNKGYTIAFDMASKGRTKDKLLFKQLQSFNDLCKSKEFDKTMKYSLDNASYVRSKQNESSIIDEGPEPQPINEDFISLGTILGAAGKALSTGTIAAAKTVAAGAGAVTGLVAAHPVIASIVGIIGLFFVFIKFIRNLIYYFYYSRVTVSDYIDNISNMMYINALNAQNKLTEDEASKAKWIATQMKLAKFGQALANKINVDDSNASKDTNNSIQAMDKMKFSYNDVATAVEPSMTSTSLF